MNLNSTNYNFSLISDEVFPNLKLLVLVRVVTVFGQFFSGNNQNVTHIFLQFLSKNWEFGNYTKKRGLIKF